MTLYDIYLTIMSSESQLTILTEFQFSDISDDVKDLNTEFFKTAIIKDSER